MYCYEEAEKHYGMGWGFAVAMKNSVLSRKILRFLLNMDIWSPLQGWESMEYKQYKAMDSWTSLR